MKGIRLLFATCLASLVFWGATADDSGDTVRAATRRVSSNQTTTTQTRTRGTASDTKAADTSTRRTTTSSQTNNRGSRGALTDKATNQKSQSVVQRNSATTATRPATQSQTPSTRPTPTSSRNTTVQRTTTARSATSARTGTRSQTSARTATTGLSRLSRAASNAATVIGEKYKKCREVYNSCMDEFCANKDAQLKRCACSSRYSEFDNIKQQLSNISDKMLDFNERLVAVNLDKEDALAINKETEGEKAFNASDDNTKSKKLLEEISQKLNKTFSDDSSVLGLSTISLSLNEDSAFDNIDSLMGASTTTKTGTALFSAALPICREMAAEVCTDDELTIAESGYQMLVEQDCNTVAKSYQTQTDEARAKVRESGALLDMSRLDIYQQRNSDDLLTCKKKMLDMLTDASVCGTDMGKCLDTTGQYIDPTTGTAFLTKDLANLTKLITRPTGNQTWTGAPGNDKFISFLNSKKKFLEPAMENCQSIADYVWDAFVEDALGQIKIAQDKKLEDVRQSCTTLTAECLSNTMESISDFDARALSIFGVTADKTANAMCADIKNACTALMDTTLDTSATTTSDTWATGITGIQSDKTYDTILQTCREVGRTCIIQTCKSISGNFGLCESLTTSVNRKSIINRTACWNEVKNCVASAGDSAIDNIIAQITGTDYNLANDYNSSKFYYDTLYGANITKVYSGNTCDPSVTSSNCVYDICYDDCIANYKSTKCEKCRIAERIWGNCEDIPANLHVSNGTEYNKIKEPQNDLDTLLYWFAKNTGTQDKTNSCRDSSCHNGQTAIIINNSASCYDTQCLSETAGEMCIYNDCTSTSRTLLTINITNSLQNCCNENTNDFSHNCCKSGSTTHPSPSDGGGFGANQISGNLCTAFSGANMYFVTAWSENSVNYSLFCMSSSVPTSGTDGPTCVGTYVVVDSAGHYFKAQSGDTNTLNLNDGYMSFRESNGTVRTYSNGSWGNTATTPTHWSVSYN